MGCSVLLEICMTDCSMGVVVAVVTMGALLVVCWALPPACGCWVASMMVGCLSSVWEWVEVRVTVTQAGGFWEACMLAAAARVSMGSCFIVG